jgi:hypothetical protein
MVPMKPVFLPFLLCSLILPVSLPAQTSFPMLGGVLPVGVKRGTTADVTVSVSGNGGPNLYGAYKVLFADKGIQAEIVPPEKGWQPPDPAKPWALPYVGQVTMRVTVAPDVLPGTREFRIATRRAGTSSVGQLIISDEPELKEAEPNNAPEQAQLVTVPCVINGAIGQSEDTDAFKFKAEAGQELVFAVLCARLQDKIHDLDPHADPLIVLTDAQGKEMASNDDFNRADPLLRYKFAASGEYRIQIRDVGYKGNANWVYRLNITARPYVTGVLPCVVPIGASTDVQVVGVNIGTTARVTVPAGLMDGIVELPLQVGDQLTNPVPIRVASGQAQTVLAYPVAMNTTGAVLAALSSEKDRGNVPSLSLPGSVNSALAQETVPHLYKFSAKKGEPWGFEVTARRVGSKMDAELKLRDAKGNVLAANDDTFGKDSRIEWTAPNDGEFLLEVRDLAGKAGANYFYNISAAKLRPDFGIKCDTDRAMIAPGNRTTWYIQAERRHGFAGEIKIEVKGLPAGVTASALTVPANMTTGTIFLTAAPDAKQDAALVEVIGTATLPDENGKSAEVTHTAIPITEVYLPGGGRGLYPVQTQAVGITEANDLEVSANTQNITLKPGESVKIEMEIKRRADYNKPVTLDVRVQHLGGVFVNPLPPGVTVDDGASKTLLSETENKGWIVLKAAPDAAEIKNLPLAVLANSSVNFVMKVWYAAPPISLSVQK